MFDTWKNKSQWRKKSSFARSRDGGI